LAATSPARQLSAAQTASSLNPWSVTPLYLEASALESQGKRSQALGKLMDALKLEPRNFVTLGLIGDYYVRGGHRRAARVYYRRALVLDPRDVGLQQLAASK
jgi:Tfp pilus assembly protein PilF